MIEFLTNGNAVAGAACLLLVAGFVIVAIVKSFRNDDDLEV